MSLSYLWRPLSSTLLYNTSTRSILTLKRRRFSILRSCSFRSEYGQPHCGAF